MCGLGLVIGAFIMKIPNFEQLLKMRGNKMKTNSVTLRPGKGQEARTKIHSLLRKKKMVSIDQLKKIPSWRAHLTILRKLGVNWMSIKSSGVVIGYRLIK